MVGKKWILLLGIFFSQLAFSQGHLQSNIKFNKSSVFKGEPMEVSVEIFTSTWFTKGINPGNIKVNGAFTVYFRSLSTSKQINGKTYAGVIMYFNVFPYEDKDVVFPALTFTVETPDEGDYIGVNQTVKTKERSIKVNPIPPGFKKSEWMVTNNTMARDNWSNKTGKAKVGDVITRQISLKVSNTVSELIPPIIWDSVSGVSQYPLRSDVENYKTNTTISASRTDRIQYLLEEEGTVKFPEIVIKWWNPISKKQYKKTLPAYTLQVEPNPDLGMLQTIIDSLSVNALNAGSEENGKEPFSFLKMDWKELIAVIIFLIILFYSSLKIGKNVWTFFKAKRAAYLQSEKYYFKLFVSSTKSGSTQKTLDAMYTWIAVVKLPVNTAEYLIKHFGGKELAQNWEDIEMNIQNKKSLKFNISLWKEAREQVLNPGQKSSTGNWINP